MTDAAGAGWRSMWPVGRVGTPMLAAALIAAGCSALPVDIPPPERTVFWQSFQFDQSMEEVSRFDTLRDLHDASDAVVTGRVVGVRTSRIIQGDAAEARVAYVCVDLRVQTVISGAAPEELCLEFLGGSPAAAEALVRRSLAVGLPLRAPVVFLHEKRGQGEAGLYPVTNSTGLWAETSRAALDAPLRPQDPATSGLYRHELAGVETLSDLITMLQRL